MGECGCGARPFDTALKLKRNVVLGLRVYDGCPDCFPGIGVDVCAFTSAKNEFLESAGERQEMLPDEYGGNGGSGWTIGLFEVCDLKAAAEKLNADEEILAFGNILDWLDDFGLDLIQEAHRNFTRRMKEMRSKHAPEVRG